MNDPPLHTAVFRAANLLSPGGMTVPKYCLTRSGYSRMAVSMSQNKMPWASRSSRLRWKTTSESYWAVTPARYLRSASGMPSFSYVVFICSGRSSHSSTWSVAGLR